eukprot:SAG22_NODE_4398_length_1282_cov_2.201183_3_plen_147_part_01
MVSRKELFAARTDLPHLGAEFAAVLAGGRFGPRDCLGPAAELLTDQRQEQRRRREAAHRAGNPGLGEPEQHQLDFGRGRQAAQDLFGRHARVLACGKQTNKQQVFGGCKQISGVSIAMGMDGLQPQHSPAAVATSSHISLFARARCS